MNFSRWCGLDSRQVRLKRVIVTLGRQELPSASWKDARDCPKRPSTWIEPNATLNTLAMPRYSAPLGLPDRISAVGEMRERPGKSRSDGQSGQASSLVGGTEGALSSEK